MVGDHGAAGVGKVSYGVITIRERVTEVQNRLKYVLNSMTACAAGKILNSGLCLWQRRRERKQRG